MKCLKFNAFILVLLCFFITGCNNTDKQAFSDDVAVFEVNNSTIDYREFYGSVKSQLHSELSFQTEGRIEYIPFTKGDFVKKGTVLARLDGILYKIRKNEELARLQDNLIQLNKSQSYYKRMNILHQKGAISDNDWEDAYYSYLTNKQSVEIQREKIKYLEKEINYNIISAPFDGYISEKLAEVGSYAKIGSPVLVLNGSNKTQVEVVVDSDIVNSLDLNKAITIERNGLKYQGTIKHISKTSKNQGGYLIKIVLDELYDDLKEGMSISAFIPNKEDSFYKIPLNSIVDLDDDKYVYKVVNIKNNSGTVEKEKVDVKNIVNEDIEITKGLKKGDLIIKNPLLVKPGAKIKL